MKFPRSPVSITRCDLKYGCTGIIATLQTKHLALAAYSLLGHMRYVFLLSIYPLLHFELDGRQTTLSMEGRHIRYADHACEYVVSVRQTDRDAICWLIPG